MVQDTKKKKLIVNKLTTQQYLDALENNLINDDELYMTTDSPVVYDVKVNGTSVISNNVADITLGTMATESASDYYTKTQADSTFANIEVETTKVDKVSTANKVYGTDSSGNQTTYDVDSFGKVDDVKVGDTSVVTNKIATLGTMAGENTTSYYTKTEVDGKLSGAMHFKGTVATVDDLPSSDNEVGDMYNVTSTGANYAWDGENWDKLSENIDLSGIYTKTEVDDLLDVKQDVITDLETIRSGASLGATALQPNTAITGATHTKITYDSNGLVTSGTDLTESDIPSLTLSKISDITATASEVNVLDGITASTDELNYVEGVTSNIQTQLNAKQETLVSGTNIKTVGGNSLLGSGNIDFPTVDQTYDATSSNAQSGVAVADAISGKANISDLATVATSGSYNDLSDKPSIPAAQVNSDWNATSGVAQILNKPTIPTVNNATLTIQANGTDVATFTANASTDVTANITIPDSATWGNISGTLSNQTDLNTALNAKQETLVSGTNIKTVNGTSILGSGDLTTGQKHIGGTQPLSGAALLANQLVYINTNKVYPSTNKTLNIEPSFGLQLCSSAISNNTEVTSDKLLQKASVIDLTNIPHDTLEKGNPCYFRCILKGSIIQSDNYVATSMLAGYTWYYIGIAQSSTAINFDTTQSFFITLNSTGRVTHINGKELAGGGAGSSSKRIVESFTATANQTTFTVANKIVSKNYVSVNVDNVELTDAAYSLSDNGMSVILGTGVTAGALVDIKYFTDIGLADSGATFTPNVSKSGYTTTLSWSNDRSLPNPSTVTITDGVIYTPSQSKSGSAAVISWSNNQGKTNPANITLYDGVTFTPSVSVNQTAQTATLSWTNDGGKTNPAPLTIYLGQDNTTQRYIDRFTATANQKVFVATKDIQSKNVLSVNVDNSELLNDGFTLSTDKRTVTLNDGCEAGAIVELKYFHNLIMAQDGNTYIPHVSKSNYTTTLSWTNDGELTNPANVNILDGVIYTPAVSATTGGYNLSWTNNQGKTNPSTVFINSVYAVGAWASASTYKAGNMVTYEDTNYQYGYIAKQSVPAGTSLTNTTYWMQAYAIAKTYVAATIVDWGE